MKAAWLLTAAMLAVPALAADTPKCDPSCYTKLTCEQRIARAKKEGCVVPCTPVIVDHDVTDCSKCPTNTAVPVVVTKEVPGPERVVTKTVTVTKTIEVMKPLNYVDFGPIFSRGWGGQANYGHIWTNGLKFNIGVNRIDQDPTRGQYGCPMGGDQYPDLFHHGGTPPPCVPTPWEAPAPNPWGGGATLGYAW